MDGARWFYRNNEEWVAMAQQIKLAPCQHCEVVGMLIRHGGLQGCDESGRLVLRARRVFCSNRNQRSGCGRTFSVWTADHIQRLKVTTGRLWQFLIKAVVGTMGAAIRDLNSRLSDRTWQRIWKRFDLAQSPIRTALMNQCPAPDLPLQSSNRPAAQVLAHLRAACPGAICPIAAFQFAVKTFVM